MAAAAGGLWLLWRFDPADWHVPLCRFYATTGLYCPGCGAIRATHELLHGRLWAALHDNALWIAALPLAAYAATAELRYLLCGRTLPGNPARNVWVLWAVAAASVAFCVLRNLPWMPFVLLAPPR